jgi:multidrug resistance efflux pump
VRAAEEAVSTAIMAEYAKTHACSHPALAIMMQDMAEEQSAVDAALTTVNGSEKLVDQARATLKAAEAALSKAKGDVVTQEALYRGFAVGA